MRAGRLNQTIDIHRYTQAQDSYGQQSRTWAKLSTIRAEVRQTSATENEYGGRFEGRQLYRVTCRYTDIKQKDRIVWGAKTLEIIEVIDPSHRRTELQIKAVIDE